MNTECKWVRSHLGEFLDQELAADAHSRAEKHLSSCVDCRAALVLLQRVDRVSGEVLAEGESAALSELKEAEGDALMRSIKSRFDLKGAAELRMREMEQEGPNRRSYLSGEEVADQSLEATLEHSRVRAGVRDDLSTEHESVAQVGWLRRFVQSWLNPTPAWRWVQVAGATAAVAALAVLIFARDPDLSQRALRHDVPSELPPGATYDREAAPIRAFSDDVLETFPSVSDQNEPTKEERLKSLGEAAGASDADADAGADEKRDVVMKAAQADGVETEEAEPAETFEETIEPEPAAPPSPAGMERAAPRRDEKKSATVSVADELLERDFAGESEPSSMSAAPGVRLEAGPGWEHAQSNLLKVLDPSPARNAMLLKLKPTDLMKEAESQLLVVSAEAPKDVVSGSVGARDDAWGSVKGMFEGSTEAETTARHTAGRGMRALPGGVASNVFTRQRVEDRALLSQDIIEQLAGPLPESAADVRAWRALGDGWYVLWEADPDDADKARRAAAFYAALVEVATGQDSPEAANEEMNRQLEADPEILTQILDRLEKLHPRISD